MIVLRIESDGTRSGRFVLDGFFVHCICRCKMAYSITKLIYEHPAI